MHGGSGARRSATRGEGVIEAGQQGRIVSLDAAQTSKEDEGKTRRHLGDADLPLGEQADETEVMGAVPVMVQGLMKGVANGEQAGNQQKASQQGTQSG